MMNHQRCKSFDILFEKKILFQLFLLIMLRYYLKGAVVIVIIWKLDLQLPVQSVPITTKALSSNPIHVEVYSFVYICDKVYQ